MAGPTYPTKEGQWSAGQRQEASYAGVRLGLPYAQACANFRGAVQGRDDFDPAVLFVWGTMQAKGLLYMLEALEEAFGEEGQQVARKAINKAGFEACQEMLANSQLPKDASEIELLSFIVTGINCVLYASLEKPWIVDENRFDFDILWCPHQDIFRPFDCRIQRYFVEGMIGAVEAAGYSSLLPVVDKFMPKGADCCHFQVTKRDNDGDNPWNEYSNQLAARALARKKAQDAATKDQQDGKD